MTTLHVPDGPKMLRETLCVAQAAIARAHLDDRDNQHVRRIQALIDECDRLRPLGPDGTHGNLHTPECGCDDKRPDPWAPKLREQVLDAAKTLLVGQRAADYGDAVESFNRLALLWSAVLDHNVTPEQVALCLLQLKVSRLCVTPTHQDSWIDAAGYAALGAEIAARPEEVPF